MRRTLFAIALFALPIFAACGGSGDGPTQPTAASISGTYDLKTINGVSLPFVVQQVGADKVEWTSDVVTANNGSFTQLSTFRVTENGQVSSQTVSDAGTYVVNGTAATFQFQSDNSTGTATISGNAFTIAQEGLSLHYVKR